MSSVVVNITVGDKVFTCRASWTVEKTKKNIRDKYGIAHGGLECDGVAMGDEETLNGGGSYSFVGGVSSSGEFL